MSPAVRMTVVAMMAVVIAITRGSIFGNLGSGDGTNGTTHEGARGIADKGASASAKRAADESAAFAGCAGDEGGSRPTGGQAE